MVILVDEKDREIGAMEKLEAHQKALLHRAISVFMFDSQGQWLLQRRAAGKYHSPGLWTNTCCTHPMPDEPNIAAANRRLEQEMGMCGSLSELFSFTYREELDQDLTEHEFDHVFMGVTDALPRINPDEVAEYKYISFEELDEDVCRNPDHYTVWFRKIYRNVQFHRSQQAGV